MLITLCISGLLLLTAYLLGSIPTGFLAARWLEGIDIREHGSGSIGATNVLRTVGKRAAIAVLLFDALKGALAVSLINIAYLTLPVNTLPISWQTWLLTIAGLLAVLGHSCSIWLNFMGGKSVAISIGILLVMNPFIALSTIAAFLICLGLSRIVSLSSIVGAITVNALMLSFQQPIPYQIFVSCAGIYVIWRHRTNIKRLFAGTEPKIGQKLTSKADNIIHPENS